MPMRLLVLLFSIAMPLVAWFSQRGVFGPDNGTVSGQYPTLLVAAGYAFAIWGLIFAFDLVHGIWQPTGDRRQDKTLSRIAPTTAAGFALTALWMPLFSMGRFWLCLLVIFAALAAWRAAPSCCRATWCNCAGNGCGRGRRCRCMPAGCRWLRSSTWPR